MRRAAALIAVIGGAVVGCLDFVDPSPRPAELVAGVSLRDEDPPTLRLQASFTGGASDDVAPLVRDPGPLRIWDRSISPTQVSGRTVYEAEWTPDPADLRRAALVVQPPALPGRPDSALSLPLVWRAGPDSLTVGDDGLLLPLRVPRPGPDSILVSWNLRVQPASEDGFADGTVLVSGRGLPPDSLRVSRSLLPAGSVPLTAGLSVSASTAPEAGAGSTARLFLSTAILWTVTR